LGTSGDDEYFRLFLAANQEASQHPTVKLLHEPIMRSLARPQARGFASSFWSQIHNLTILSPGGIYLGKAPGLLIDHVRLQRIVEKVVRGLFFHEYKNNLPPRCGIRSVFLNSMRQHVLPDEFNGFVNSVRGLLAGGNERHIGPNDEFVCHFNASPCLQYQSVWVMIFYCHLHFVAFTDTNKRWSAFEHA
jgi:hypothetical protein